MDPRRLRTLLAVARAGSVIAAAEELFITPSAVSQQIKQLEREAGRVLVMRTSRGTVLTPAGQIAAQAAEEIERVVGDARDRLHEDSGPSGTVRIGGLASVHRALLAPHLNEWRDRFPRLQLQLVEGNTGSLTRSLRRRDLHAALVELDKDADDDPLPPSIVEEPLLDEPWKFVAPAAWLLDDDQVDPSRCPVPWLGVEAATTESAIERLRRLVPLEPTPTHLYYESSSGVTLVAQEQGVTVMPALTLRGIVPDDVRVIDLPRLGTRSIVLRRFGGSHTVGGPIHTALALIHEAVEQFDPSVNY
ncbi:MULTISPECIES: LysR family transcriptional regulator [Microbacterium]|uniref:LysR family transcriptional regulator n=1 Tax=Microbacterium TaxID=33882 RepID=UPI000D64C617|nr:MULTISPECIES: LysR family transcriptional regulator [Microbacterium]